MSGALGSTWYETQTVRGGRCRTAPVPCARASLLTRKAVSCSRNCTSFGGPRPSRRRRVQPGPRCGRRSRRRNRVCNEAGHCRDARRYLRLPLERLSKLSVVSSLQPLFRYNSVSNWFLGKRRDSVDGQAWGMQLTLPAKPSSTGPFPQMGMPQQRPQTHNCSSGGVLHLFAAMVFITVQKKEAMNARH